MHKFTSELAEQQEVATRKDNKNLGTLLLRVLGLIAKVAVSFSLSSVHFHFIHWNNQLVSDKCELIIKWCNGSSQLVLLSVLFNLSNVWEGSRVPGLSEEDGNSPKQDRMMGGRCTS